MSVNLLNTPATFISFSYRLLGIKRSSRWLPEYTRLHEVAPDRNDVVDDGVVNVSLLLSL